MSDYWQQIVNLAKQSGALDVRVTHNNKIIAHLAARLNALAKRYSVLEKAVRKHTNLSGFEQDAQWADADGLADRITVLEKRVAELEETSG